MVCTEAAPVGGILSFGEQQQQQHKRKPDNLSVRSKYLQIFIDNNGLNLKPFVLSWWGQSFHPFVTSVTTKSGTNLRSNVRNC